MDIQDVFYPKESVNGEPCSSADVSGVCVQDPEPVCYGFVCGHSVNKAGQLRWCHGTCGRHGVCMYLPVWPR